MGRGPIPGVGPCHHEWGHILGGGVTSLGVEPHRWDRAMSLQVKPLHGGGATAPVVGPRHCGWGHVIGVGLPHWGVAMLLNVGPSHWGWAHLTGMEPPHWGPHLWRRPQRGSKSCHSAVCVRDHFSTASSLPHLSANLSLFMGSYFSVCRPRGEVQQQHALSHVQMCAHMRIQASPAAALPTPDLGAWKPSYLPLFRTIELETKGLTS